MFQRITTLGFTAALIAASLTPAAAQQADNVVGVFEFWTSHSQEDPTECWTVSKPAEWAAFEGSNDVTSRTSRGDILLFVAFRPDQGVSGEIAFDGGYTFAEGSTVTVEIGDESFDLVTQGDFAWPPSTDEDERMVAAMRAGATAVITGRSSRGKTTKDEFSLIGFTDAYEDAASRCSG